MIAYSTTTNSVTLHHKANDYVDFKKEFTHHPKNHGKQQLPRES